MDMVQRPSPDLVLRNTYSQALLTIECKASSFGPDTTQARQTLALLACSGPHLSTLFAFAEPDDWTTTAVFAVTHPQQGDMNSCLQTLASRLETSQIAACSSASVGIELRANGVYLSVAEHAQMPFSMPDTIKVVELQLDEDPRSLYVVPLDPSINAQDAYGKRVVEERVRTALVYELNARLVEGEVAVSWDELMSAAIEVWPLWNDRNSTKFLRDEARRYVERVLTDLASVTGVQGDSSQIGLTLKGITIESASSIRRYLTSPRFRRVSVDLLQDSRQLGLEGV